MTPAQDINWMERITPALHANVHTMYAALELLATNAVTSHDRTVAHNALNKVFGWRPAAVEPVAVGELDNEIVNDLLAEQVWNPKEN